MRVCYLFRFGVDKGTEYNQVMVPCSSLMSSNVAEACQIELLLQSPCFQPPASKRTRMKSVKACKFRLRFSFACGSSTGLRIEGSSYTMMRPDLILAEQ